MGGKLYGFYMSWSIKDLYSEKKLYSGNVNEKHILQKYFELPHKAHRRLIYWFIVFQEYNSNIQFTSCKSKCSFSS